jgi:uncharacterized protein
MAALDLTTFVIAALGVFLIAFTKGAFGGGFASIGIPLLALVMDPLTAGAVLAPLFILMDLCALRYWKPSTWSKPDVIRLVPGLIVGIAVGYVTLRYLDPRAFAIIMALITLTFVALWFRSGGTVVITPRSSSKATAAGFASGITTKQVYPGTTSLIFTVANAVKVVPWLWLVQPTEQVWVLMALCAPVIPLGVWVGWKLHQRLNQLQLYRACYALLVITALKLLWDGVSGYLR